MDSNLMNRYEVANRLFVSQGTVRNMVKRGELPDPVCVGRRQYFPRDVVARIEREGTGGFPKAA